MTIIMFVWNMQCVVRQQCFYFTFFSFLCDSSHQSTGLNPFQVKEVISQELVEGQPTKYFRTSLSLYLGGLNTLGLESGLLKYRTKTYTPIAHLVEQEILRTEDRSLVR